MVRSSEGSVLVDQIMLQIIVKKKVRKLVSTFLRFCFCVFRFSLDNYVWDILSFLAAVTMVGKVTGFTCIK